MMLLAMGALGCQGAGAGLPETASENAKAFARLCDDGDAESCFALGLVWHLGDATYHGVERDPERAARLFRKSCSLGHQPACDAAETPPPLITE